MRRFVCALADILVMAAGGAGAQEGLTLSSGLPSF